MLSACTVSKSEPLTATYHIFALYVMLRVLRIDIFHTALIAAVVLNVREETSCCNLQYFHWNCAVPSQYLHYYLMLAVMASFVYCMHIGITFIEKRNKQTNENTQKVFSCFQLGLYLHYYLMLAVMASFLLFSTWVRVSFKQNCELPWSHVHLTSFT